MYAGLCVQVCVLVAVSSCKQVLIPPCASSGSFAIFSVPLDCFLSYNLHTDWSCDIREVEVSVNLLSLFRGFLCYMPFKISFVCICIHVFKIEPEVKVDCVFNSSPSCFLSQGLTLNLELAGETGRAASPREPLVSASSAGIPGVPLCPVFTYAWGFQVRPSCLPSQHFIHLTLLC